jgi:enamine deaminase RidA (YjgF/YER057c/UK114 family)
MEKITTSSGRIAVFHGVPWEQSYAYPQAIQKGRTIYVSGQLSHDATGEFVGPAARGEDGLPSEFSMMELQMRTTYTNAARVLAQYGASLSDVVEETLFVLDVDAAFAVAGQVRREAYGTDMPECASNLIGVPRLALPVQLIEITFRAELPHT